MDLPPCALPTLVPLLLLLLLLLKCCSGRAVSRESELKFKVGQTPLCWLGGCSPADQPCAVHIVFRSSISEAASAREERAVKFLSHPKFSFLPKSGTLIGFLSAMAA